MNWGFCAVGFLCLFYKNACDMADLFREPLNVHPFSLHVHPPFHYIYISLN